MRLVNTIKSMVPFNAGYHLRRLKLVANQLLYKGSKYYCPLCDRFYSQFFAGGFDLPVIKEYAIIGAGLRANMVCPGCSATDRDRLLHSALTSPEVQFLPADSLLHIAPEPSISDWISNHKKEILNNYTKGVKYFEGFYYQKDTQLIDITDLLFEDNHFDRIICNHVLEHIPDEAKAMTELFRVLKPGGLAFLQVPWSPLINKTIEDQTHTTIEEREKYYGQFDHVRLYGTDYPSKLTEIGFSVKQLMPFELGFDDNYLESIAINPKEVIFVAAKQVES